MTTTTSDDLTAADLAFLDERGITRAEAERQLRLLRGPRPHVVLDRPCTRGDGIEVIGEERVGELLAAHAEAAAAGRLMTFVPASGAATRMFKDLIAFRGQSDLTREAAPALATFLDNLHRFAFAGELARVLGGDPAQATPAAVLDALLGDGGLGYGELPKGLLAFHLYPDGARTPLEEHLVEAARLVRDAAGRCRLHFTVSPEHRALFTALAARAAAAFGARFGVDYEIGFSVQSPATDTLAVDGEGRVVRAEDDTPLLRPAGHGALLANLQELGGDLVLIKNIDNVAAERCQEATITWSRVLLGRLATAQRRVRELQTRLDPGEARAFLGGELHLTIGDDREEVARALARPLRVCGMVPNTGEPGGGPCWVRGAGAQIVESAQVDTADAAQKQAFSRATHFNPVFLACGVRDHRGQPYDLERFVDPSAAIQTRKSTGGRELVALERPGLWNGAMAGWNTIFVEVPLAVFNPVKTVNDLLRAEHQPPL